MMKNLKFQRVLPDMSNTNPMSLREEDNDDDSTTSTNDNNDDDDLDSSVIWLPQTEKEGTSKYSSELSSLFLGRSTWRTANEECAICLQGYEAGQTIGTSATSSTQYNHVFHQDCMEEWLKDHDNCPMCRVNLMCSPQLPSRILFNTSVLMAVAGTTLCQKWKEATKLDTELENWMTRIREEQLDDNDARRPESVGECSGREARAT
eukprot:scaffold1772_cov80-Cylindrotheca_fusiformis.AAC.4